jgi:hypothetical protein
MEPRGERPAWLPAEPDGRLPRRPDPTPEPAEPSRWARLVRSPRGAAGIAVLAAALLLWPFTGWSAWPWLIGLGVLVLLYLLRLDRLLRGWAPHLAGLGVVGGMLYGTSPWAWALAASIGVLLAGLARLPRSKVVAIGTVMCVVSGVGFGVSQYQTAQEKARAEAEANKQSEGQQGARRPQGVLPILLNRIAQNVPEPICGNLISDSALPAFVGSTGQPDCAAAVASLASRVTDRQRYAGAQAMSVAAGEGLDVDACALRWASGTAAGPPLGHLTIRYKPGGASYVVTGFSAC